jgi:hypothetical protein
VTRTLRIRFGRLIVIGAISAGALGLAVGTAAAATAGGEPYPAPSPTATVYTPPPWYGHPVTRCFLSLETEHDTLAGQPYGDGQYGGSQYGSKHQDSIEVVQLVRVCVTQERGWRDRVQVWDVTGPFAWEVPASGPAPTPSGLPAVMAPFLVK